jgi:hypothetical protein
VAAFIRLAMVRLMLRRYLIFLNPNFLDRLLGLGALKLDFTKPVSTFKNGLALASKLTKLCQIKFVLNWELRICRQVSIRACERGLAARATLKR